MDSPALEIPTIETERLRLRGWREDDLDIYAEMMADPDVMRFLGGPLARIDAWRSLASAVGHWVLRGFGLWAVERKEDGVLIGRVGVQRPEGWPGTEVGWTLDRRYWGNGYATEAAKASLDYGFRTTSLPKLISLIDPENQASQRVAERLGETKSSTVTLTLNKETFTTDIWEITRDRWSGG
jgi:RimJ/RimL family protein N-acetyltransferase